MPERYDFKVELSFKGVRLAGEDEEALKRELIQLANTQARDAMCQDWRDMWEQDATTITLLEMVQADQVASVRISVDITKQVRLSPDVDGEADDLIRAQYDTDWASAFIQGSDLTVEGAEVVGWDIASTDPEYVHERLGA